MPDDMHSRVNAKMDKWSVTSYLEIGGFLLRVLVLSCP